MVNQNNTKLQAIDFSADIALLTEDFTGREWVFKEIQTWLEESNKRFFIKAKSLAGVISSLDKLVKP